MSKKYFYQIGRKGCKRYKFYRIVKLLAIKFCEFYIAHDFKSVKFFSYVLFKYLFCGL